MGWLFRSKDEDSQDPDLLISRHFLFGNRQSEANKLKSAERKYGLTLAELHAYRHLMMLPAFPQQMLEERPDLKAEDERVRRLVQIGGEVSTSAERQSEATPSDAPFEGARCESYYRALDRCVTTVWEEDKRNRWYKHTRLHACKPHWDANLGGECGDYVCISLQKWMRRCTDFRDNGILKEITAWEAKHTKSLSPSERKAYTDRLEATHRYLEYRSMNVRDDVEGVKLSRELDHLSRRLRKLRERQSADNIVR